eukprot:scaffold1634_cov118-Skeletonema_dohrnii-CCMP3373.AAC.5
MAQLRPQLRRNLINIATDLKAISLHLRHSTDDTNPLILILSEELSSLSSKLVEDAAFVEEHRSSDPKISEDELEQETLDSGSQSMDRLLPMLNGASENEQERPSDIAQPITHSSQQIPVPSAVIAHVDEDSDATGSQSQEEEILSLATATTASDVFDTLALDLRAIAKSNHLELVKRIQEAYFEATLKADVQFHLMFGQFDVWSLMNIAKSDFSRNKSSIRDRERQLKSLLLLMKDRSTANGQAKMYRLIALEERKKSELKSIDEDHISMDLFGPASSLLTALQEDEEEDKRERNDAYDNCPYYAAATSAAKESGITTDWIDLVKFVAHVKNSMNRHTLEIIMCRVMQMVPFYSIAQSIKNKNIIAFLDRKLVDWRDPEHSVSVANVWDSIIIPSLQDGTPDADMIQAYRLTVFIAQRLSFKDFEEYFQKAESIPLIELFEECDAAQCLRSFKSGNMKSYFLAEDSNVKDNIDKKKRAKSKSVLAKSRRLTAARSYLLPPTFTCAVQRLRDRCLLSDEDVSTSVFGINCMSASKFVTPKYNLLWDEERLINPQRGDEECIWRLIEDISRLGEKAAKAFESDYITLDLTQDIADDTSKTLERLNDYFRLCICSDSTDGIEV